MLVGHNIYEVENVFCATKNAGPTRQMHFFR